MDPAFVHEAPPTERPQASIVDAVREHESDKRPAIIGHKRTTSYEELIELAGRLTGGLQRRFPENGDPCLVVSHPNLEESLALTLAGWSLGHRVAVLPSYLKERELEDALEQCGPAVMVSDQTPDSSKSVSFAALLDAPPHKMGSAATSARLEAFTSGTAGRSLCVDREVSRLSADVANLVAAIRLTAADTVTAIGTALSTTSVLPALFAGATVATIGLHSPRQFWQAITDKAITVISAAPYTYEFAMRKQPEAAQVRRVRTALTASARLRPGTARQLMRKTGIPVRNIMCSSESGHITYNDAADEELLATSVGRAMAGVDIEVRGADGTVLPPGQPGRICVRSPYVASHYRNQPDATAAVFQGDRVVSTDVGYLDAAGYLRLTGRDDWKIHFGAAKLDPKEVENVLLGHPVVSGVVVTGEQHDRLGQIPVAHVVTSCAITAAELLTYCRERISTMKVPQRIEFVNAIAKDADGQPIRQNQVRFD
jgi:long-chain acyl-CoA synthetase